MKPFDIPNDALQVMPENAYWRDVANYDRVIAKLYFYLKPLNWQPIEAAHATGWHKQGVQSIRKRYDDCQDSYPWVALDRIYDSRYERFKGCIRTTSLISIQKGSRGLVQLNYVGRLIRRDVLQGAHHARRFAELTLPIPAPAAYAQRQMQTAWHLWAKDLAQLDEQAQATSPNRREYLAIRLRRISLELSDANTLLSGGLSAWLASGSLREVLKVEKAWLLSPQLEPLDFDISSWINPPAPDKVGEIRAKVDCFWQCLYDFLEAERPSIPAPLAASAVIPEATGIKPKPAAMPVAFDHYIKEEYREKLLPFLAREYAGQKPQEIACMLIALKDLAALTYPLQSNVTVLHAALDAFLKGAGTRQSLADNLTKLNKASQKEHIKIQTHCARIKTYMEQG